MEVKITYYKDDGTILTPDERMPLHVAIKVLKRLERNLVEKAIKEALESKQPYILLDFFEEK